MTEQERYLITFLNETFGHHESDIDSEAFAKRLIQRYPQILAEKVFGGRYDHGGGMFPAINEYLKIRDDGSYKIYEVFIREVPND